MATFYGKLKASSQSAETKPIEAITKRSWSDGLFLIRGRDKGVPAWHYILVPHTKRLDLKSQKTGSKIDCDSFGSIIEYRNDQNRIVHLSGWGKDPPKVFQTWVNEYYEQSADENTEIEYTSDDIRLCTMQRLTVNQKVGIFYNHSSQFGFHYIELSNSDSTSSLAYRAGIRNYDRLICFNGVNIESETIEQISKRFNTQLHLPVQLLVCSPATYIHYQESHMKIHADLPTVQRLRPVFDLSPRNDNLSSKSSILPYEESFYVVQIESSDTVAVLSQSLIFKSPEMIHIGDICFVEFDANYHRAQIKFQGSKNQCEQFHMHFDKQPWNNNLTIDSKLNRDLVEGVRSQLEELPNEFFYGLFDYFQVKERHDAFFHLNTRFNNLLYSSNNISLTLDDKIDSISTATCGYVIQHLIMNTSNQFDLKPFSNLHSFILCHRSPSHIEQIRSEIMPNLVNLSLLLKSDFKTPTKLLDEIFSNQLPSLRYATLGQIDNSSFNFQSTSLSLRYLAFRSDDPSVFASILSSCPNLVHIQFHILYNKTYVCQPSTSSSHTLKRLTLWSDMVILSSDLIESLLSYTPNVQRFYLQTSCLTPFHQLAQTLVQRFNYLVYFSCFVRELVSRLDRTNDFDEIQRKFPCFNRVRCIGEDDDDRLFATT